MPERSLRLPKIVGCSYEAQVRRSRERFLQLEPDFLAALAAVVSGQRHHWKARKSGGSLGCHCTLLSLRLEQERAKPDSAPPPTFHPLQSCKPGWGLSQGRSTLCSNPLVVAEGTDATAEGPDTATSNVLFKNSVCSVHRQCCGPKCSPPHLSRVWPAKPVSACGQRAALWAEIGQWKEQVSIWGDRLENWASSVARSRLFPSAFTAVTTAVFSGGEIFELKAELNSDKKEKKKEAVKKVIASMTVGKDVSALFPDVVNCMQTDNLELKKLVYLYLMNYAKSQPDMAIMAVNTFVKDCEDPNPLIRALAVRTMGCIRVDKITEYLCEPLRKCLKDEDPYVRKTAAVCVAKLHDINAQLVEDQGFLDTLKDLISDSNPMVVANAVAALSEIAESHPSSNLLDLNPQSINKLLTALNECTEWGQIFILDCLANYTPKDDREAQRLSHANSAVVLSAVKVLMKFMEMLSKDLDYYGTLLKKLAPPLVTLLSAEPELQYVALRNINLIVQKRPEILKHEMKVFFVKYNDPIYVKLEKLDIMIRLASQANIAQPRGVQEVAQRDPPSSIFFGLQVLAELKEYATEVDVDFVRKAVRAIGRCAIKVEQSAERCVSTLLDLIQTKVNYVVQEAIVVIKDIFRKYPNKYESVIATLCENLDSLDEPEARAAMIWIVGEYAERIDNADELLESFLEGFHDESTQVQLQLLTAIVKLFLKKPTETQELVQQVLSLATQSNPRSLLRKLSHKQIKAEQGQDSDNPDLRDRGYIYWRLLSTDPVAAKEVVLAEKPLISEETDLIEPTLLDELICYIGTLASVYHKPPSAFVEGGRGVVHKSLPPRTASSESTESPETAPAGAPPGEQLDVIPTQGDLLGDLLNLDLGPPVSGPPLATSSVQMGAVDLLGGGLDSLIGAPNFVAPPAATVPANLGAPMGSGLSDLFDLTSGVGTLSGSYVAPKAVWLPAMKAKGLEISGTFTRQVGSISMDLQLTNKALQVMTDFAIQFNRNSFGLAPAAPLQVHAPLSPNQTVEISLPLNTVGSVMKMEPLNNLQVAVKNNIDVFYFSTLYPLHILFVEDGKMDRQMFLATWKDIPNENEAQFQIRDCPLNAEAVSSRLQSSNIFTVAKRNVEGQDMLYQSLKLTNGIWVLAELRVQPGNPSFTCSAPGRSPGNERSLSPHPLSLQLSLKCRAPEVSQHVYQAYETILKN
ncbi:AP-1 complex subunit beta-1 isoform b [Camelus ferus]|nr:AP-1 complex subunit beta-1 isoform b [Camelus ferus]